MCKNKRATFASVKIEDNGTTETFYTSSVKKRSAWLTIGGLIIAAIVGLLTIRGAVVEGIQGVAGEEFRQRLDDFHNVAKPEIEESMDSKIELHEANSQLDVQQQISEVKQEVVEVKTEVSNLKDVGKENQDLLRELLRKVPD